MSVTVADLLKLPSLRGARVIAGREGLSRIISSVSVLEYAEPSFLQDELFHNNEFYGSEVVITAFANIKDDVEAQCANICRLSEAGEVGLILYYVGLLLPRVDPRLIQLADRLGFTLILMPEGRLDLRYSEVICEVMETIFRDQAENAALVSEVLDRVSRLPAHQRTVDTVLRMVCDRLHLSLMLTDASGRVLNAASWPRTAADEMMAALPRLTLPAPGADPARFGLMGGCWISRWAVAGDGSQPMYLLLLQEKQPEAAMLRQVVEVVQLAVNLWSRQHDEVATTELVRAILQDEPMKMRRLAEIFHIDVASIHSMWVLRGGRPASQWVDGELIGELRQLLASYCTSMLMDVYEDEFVVFMNGPRSLADEEAIRQGMLDCLAARREQAVLICCNQLEQTVDVRAAFLDCRNYLDDARAVFPLQSVFHLSEIRFARRCRETVQEGELALQSATAVLRPLTDSREDNELLHTLQVYLLDAQEGVTRTAQLLFVHKNTVKYRLQRCSELLGFRIGRRPETMELYRAAAVRRLVP